MIFWAWLCLGLAQALGDDQEFYELRAVQDMLLRWTKQCNVSQAFLDDCNAHKTPASIQLWGERHSGTNMMERLLRTNFRMEENIYPFAFKHMFPGEGNESRWDKKFTAAKSKQAHQVIMSRSLYDWTDALKNVNYQSNMPDEINRNMTYEEFVTQPWKCMFGEEPCFDNVVDLRRHKFNSIITNLGDINVEKIDEKQILQRGAGRALFVRYEDLSSDFGVSVACRTINRLKLCPLDDHFHPVVQIIKPGYKMGVQVTSTDSDDKRIKNRDMWKTEKALDTLNNLVDWDVEKYMGYKQLTRSTPSDDKGT